MLKIENLVVNYGCVNALRGISMEINDNEIVCLIGSNGAGKSTTLCAISNLIAKTDGEVSFLGQSIAHEKPENIVKMGISHVPEGRHVFPKATIEENLILGTMSNMKMSRAEINQNIAEMYDLFPRLKERRTQQAGTLSGGEQQMLAIARGLMIKPKLIMLDEPSLGLAPIIVDEIFDLLSKIKKNGQTVLLVEQNANMALNISDRAYLLENGVIVKTGIGSELKEDDSIRKAYLGG